MNTGKFVIMLTSLVVMALLVGAVFLPVVSSSTTRTVTTIEENEEPGWSRYAYTQTDDYSFGVSIEDDTLNIGSQGIGIQTGELSDMIILSTDALAIVVLDDSIVAITQDGAVDLGTSVNVAKTSSGLTVGDATYTAPLWSYYPSATGTYAYFDHADLLTDGKPISAWGSFAGIYAYSQFTYPDVGLVMDATITDGVIEGVTWGTAPDTLDIQPFNPGDVIFNPIDLDPIGIDLEPIDLGGGDNQIMNVDPNNGTRIGDLYYTFSGTEATVIGYASTIDWSTFTSIPDTVVDGSNTYTVVKIGDYAFQNCTNLALTSLPSGLTNLGIGAFMGCTSLALTSLPNGVVDIGGFAFQSCTNLALTSLPNGVVDIWSSAFKSCTNLALTSLPSGITTIRSSVFSGCTNLALTSLPSGITSIENSAFSNCTNLALTSLPSGLTNLGIGAFMGCTSLALTSLPSGITSIGNSAFQNCYALKTIVIYGNPTINADTFSGCSLGGLVIVDSPTFQNNSLRMAGISEVLNLGESEITTTTGGMNAEEIRTDIEAVGYIAPLSLVHHEQVMIESPTTDVINILPLVAGIGLLLIGLGVFITRRI